MRKKIFILRRTIPSNSHNAPYSFELGYHWPEGQEFARLPKGTLERYRQRYGRHKSFFIQVGGEEVILSLPTEKVDEYLKPKGEGL